MAVIVGSTIADLVLRNRHFLDQFTNGVNKRLIEELQLAQKDILERLTRGDLGRGARKHLTSVAAEATDILQNSYGGFEDVILSGLSNAARTEYWSIANAIRSQVGLKKIAENAPLQGIPAQALKNILSDQIGGELLKKWVQKQFSDSDFQIRRVFSQGLIRGQGINKIASELKKQIEISSRGAEVLVRTSIMDVSNKALEQVYGDYPKYILKYRALATLDSRTCPVCAFHDGETHETMEAFNYRYPLHPSCRCLFTPVTKYEQDDTTRPSKVVDSEGNVHLSNVSAKTSYADWFSRQNAEFQKDVLGPARYKIYQEGELELKQFIKTDKILTLNELQDKYGVDLDRFRKGSG